MSAGAPDFEVVLGALSSTLEGAGLEWYLFGAQAVVIYGKPRAPADIDVTVDLEIERWSALLDRLRPRGFLPRKAEVAAFVERTRVLPVMHEATGIPVDLVLAGPVGLEQEFLRRARSFEVAGNRIRVISPEDLIVSKILAGRPKDLEDVRGILGERRGEIDLEMVGVLLDALETALDRGDLRKELERLL